MRLFFKAFFSAIIIITLALGTVGYLLISANLDFLMAREIQNATDSFNLVRNNLISNMMLYQKYGMISEAALIEAAHNTCKTVPDLLDVKIYEGDDARLLSETARSAAMHDLSYDSLSELTLQIVDNSIVSLGAFSQNGRLIRIYECRDISAVFEQTNAMIRSYKTIYAIVLTVCAVTFYILFYIITRPVNKLVNATKRISDGEYTIQLDVNSNDEIGTLSKSFTKMAENIQAKIRELELNAQQKEDFVANFAHELKTPLTSIIGYSDMIYQKELSKEEIHDSAGYILNEGMRVEALSQKLMELIVLDKQDFILMELPVDELFADTLDTLKPILDDKEINLVIDTVQAYIFVEHDLFKTMLLNLIDNSIKAGANTITLSSRIEGERILRISITDDGCGMPEDEIPRITEAFYMVDKSRSRKQHGAGLGLAISSRIARLHDTVLVYESKQGSGTRVYFDLSIRDWI